jgi:hypothetical protein
MQRKSTYPRLAESLAYAGVPNFRLVSLVLPEEMCVHRVSPESKCQVSKWNVLADVIRGLYPVRAWDSGAVAGSGSSRQRRKEANGSVPGSAPARAMDRRPSKEEEEESAVYHPPRGNSQGDTHTTDNSDIAGTGPLCRGGGWVTNRQCLAV